MSEKFSKITSLLKALTDDPSEIRILEIKGNPPSKSRPRMGAHGVYSTPKSKSDEMFTGLEIRKAIAQPYLGNVALVCIFYRSNKQRIDTDNMLKHVCDSANGIAWIDDSQVTAIAGLIELDPSNPRTVIAIAPHVTTMQRGVDSNRGCKRCGESIHIMGLWHKKEYCDKCRYVVMQRAPRDEIRCLHCQGLFRPKVSQKICSPACRIQWLTARKRGKPKPFSQCTKCGKMLTHKRGGQCRDCWRG